MRAQAPAGLIRELADARLRLPGRRSGLRRARDVARRAHARPRPEYRVKPEADFFAEVRERSSARSCRLTRLPQAGSLALRRRWRRPLCHAGEHLQARSRASSLTVCAEAAIDDHARRSTGDVAVTVAVRGAFVSRAISPNQSPGPRSATFWPPLVHTRALPSIEHEELVTRAPLARQHRSLAQVDLVRDARELTQLGLRASREQRYLLEGSTFASRRQRHSAILVTDAARCKPGRLYGTCLCLTPHIPAGDSRDGDWE